MPRYNICMYMAHVRFYICCSDCVGGLWECVLCSNRCFSLGVLKYVVCLNQGCDGCCVCLCLVCIL